MRKKTTELCHIIISAFLILAIGSLSGYSIGFYRATQEQFPEIQIVPDTNEGVATIQLFDVQNGALQGEVKGRNARLAYDKESILELKEGAAFQIPINDICSAKNTAAKVPQGAMFVASKRGKYYYSVSDPSASSLAPQNRIYFKSKEEAEAQGYKMK